MSTIAGIPQAYTQRILHALQQAGAGRVVLFGSRARGDYSPGSDIDLALTSTHSPAQVVAMQAAIEALQLVWKVDLVATCQLSHPGLLKSIEHEGLELAHWQVI